jgi:hypothetical protein
VNRFAAKLDILPAAQRRLWNDLDAIPPGFVLYGGTALALRLGHRTSVDFDFFFDDLQGPPLSDAQKARLLSAVEGLEMDRVPSLAGRKGIAEAGGSEHP